MSDSILVRVTLDSDPLRPGEKQTQVYVQIPEVARVSWLLPAEDYVGLRDAEWGEVLDAAFRSYEQRWTCSDMASANARDTVRAWLRQDENRDALRSAWYTDRVRRDPIARPLHEHVIARDAEIERLKVSVAELEAEAAAQRRTGYQVAIEVMRQEKLPMSVELLEAQLELEKLDVPKPEARPAGAWPPALPWTALMDDEDLHDFLDELAASAITHASNATALAEVEKTCATWRLIAEAQHAHNTAPGPSAEESADWLTRLLAPTQALRETGGTE